MRSRGSGSDPVEVGTAYDVDDTAHQSVETKLAQESDPERHRAPSEGIPQGDLPYDQAVESAHPS